jgi:hypothetical protein
LILDWEANRNVWDERIKAVAAGAGVEAPEMSYRRCYDSLTHMVEQVAKQVDAEGVALLIVDSVGGGALGDSHEGDASETTRRMFTALRTIGCASLLIDHVSGETIDSDRDSGRPYGSVYKTNLARATFELRAEREGTETQTELILINRKVNNGPTLVPIGLGRTYVDGHVVYVRKAVEAEELRRHLPTKDLMGRLLKVKGAMRDEDIAIELRISESNIRNILQRHGDLFVRPAPGRIQLMSPASW